MEFSWFTVFAQIVNFVLLYVLVLKPLVFAPLQQAMAGREAIVKKSLDDAQAVAQEAQSLKQQYEAKLKEAVAEASTTVANSQREGDRLKNELIEQGRAESQRLLEKARAEIKAERDKAIGEIRTQVATLSVDLARKLLVDTLDSASQQEIVQKMLREAQTVHGA